MLCIYEPNALNLWVHASDFPHPEPDQLSIKRTTLRKARTGSERGPVAFATGGNKGAVLCLSSSPQ